MSPVPIRNIGFTVSRNHTVEFGRKKGNQPVATTAMPPGLAMVF
jgi:hypothetical protein